MFLSWAAMKLMNPLLDESATKVMTEEYADNMLSLLTVAEKLSPRAIVEAAMRAESGKELARPLGSPVMLSPWTKIFLSSCQLFNLPTKDYTSIDTKTTIGKTAKRPLNIDIPIMITGMSYGGSLSLPMKIALAKGASAAGTATCTGESALTKEERNAAKYLIGQYHRGGWLSSDEQLSALDAIEIQLGQGAWGGAVDEPIPPDMIGEELREAWRLEKGESATIYSRMPGRETTQDIIKMVNELKSRFDVPVGIKIAATDYIEYELAVIARTEADYIVIDGAEGGTSGSPPTLQDDLGLPTLFGLIRAVDYLEENNIRDRFSLIVTGGMATPGHFLKAMALGADAIYIGSIAVMAALHTQSLKVMPQAPPSQIALYKGKMKDKLDIDSAAYHLRNFLKSCRIEMQLAAQALGKQSLQELNRADLVSVERDLAEFAGLRYAASHRRGQKEDYQEKRHQPHMPEYDLPLQ